VSGEAARARYVAIITDGNGRWAKSRGLPVLAGHEAGADVVKARLRDAVDLGVRELTVYSFSTENWGRPKSEVDGLMAMFAARIDRETPELHDEGVRMRFIGRREGLSEELTRRMDWPPPGPGPRRSCGSSGTRPIRTAASRLASRPPRSARFTCRPS